LGSWLISAASGRRLVFIADRRRHSSAWILPHLT
jgi:hypothetical protein